MGVARTHTYAIRTKWTGNDGEGTSTYRSYRRDHEMMAEGKVQSIPGSSMPMFRGDGSRYNPEELLVAALSSCHMLWYLHLAADAGIVVVDYQDGAVGAMRENPDGSGEFADVVLNPAVTITDEARVAEAEALHERAHSMCFIASSVKFPVMARPTTMVRRY